MKIAVTGAQGFIGRALVSRLAELGHTPVSYQGDVQEFSMTDADIDLVIHLAARRLATSNEPFSLLETNVFGTHKVSTFCRNHNVPLIFMSSASVYAPADPIFESSPTHTASEYARSKLLAEKLLLDAASDSFPLVILRLFNPYGPGQSEDYFISEMILRAIDQKPLILKSPDSKRDFIYIDDVISALIGCIKFLVKQNHEFQEVFNLGSGKGYKVEDVAVLIAREFSSLQITKSGSASSSEAVCSNEKICRAIDWAPEISLQQGIKKTIENEKTHRRR